MKGMEKQLVLLSAENRKLRLDLSNVYSLINTEHTTSMVGAQALSLCI